MACSLKDAARLNELYRKYVSGHGPVDLPRLQRVIKHEARIAERGVIKVTRGLVRELRAERAEVGRIAKRCRE